MSDDQRTDGPPGAAIGGLPVYFEIGGGGKEHGEEVQGVAAGVRTQPFARNEEIALPTEAQVKAFSAVRQKTCARCRFFLNSGAEGAKTMYGRAAKANHAGLKSALVIEAGWDSRWLGESSRSGLRASEYGICLLDSREAHGMLQGKVKLTHWTASCDDWEDKERPKSVWSVVKKMVGVK